MSGPVAQKQVAPAQLQAPMYIAPTVAKPVYLTAESLLLYIETKLKDLDEQIDVRMKNSNANSAYQEIVQKAAGSLGNSKVEAGDEGRKTAIRNALQEAIHDLAGNPGVQAQVQTVLNDFNASAGDDVDTTEMGKLNSALGDIGKELNRSNEMSMITIQSLMSARQTAVQMTSNLMSSLNQTLQALAGNCK